jgi:O-antigen/teichoic acid export membrane protein
MSLAKRWLSNSAANLVGGLSFALFNLAIPGIVSRHLRADQFGVWSLAIQVIPYVNLLGLGLQMSTARAIAHASERNESDLVAQIIRAAHSIGRGATACALVAVVALAFVYPAIFPSVPEELVSNFRTVMLLIGASTATQLLALTPMGVFQGLHQNHKFVSAQIIVRCFAIAGIWIAARSGFQLAGLAAVIALTLALLPPLMWARLYRAMPLAKGAVAGTVNRALRRELLAYCTTLSVWSVSTLLVNCTGIVVVGRVAFDMSGSYAIAMSAATVLAGLLGALFSPLLTAAAAMNADPRRQAELPNLLLRATRTCTFGLNLLLMISLLLGQQVIRVWVGEKFVHDVTLPLFILVGAHALRNLGTPYATLLLATGLQRRALVPGVVEGLTNMLATILLGIHFGVIGVALGSLVGSLVGVVVVLAMNTPKTPELVPRPGIYILNAFVLPILVCLPAYGLIALWMNVK